MGQITDIMDDEARWISRRKNDKIYYQKSDRNKKIS